MLIFTARVRKGPIIAVAAAAALVCLALLAGSVFPPGREAAASAAVDPTGVRSNEDRIAYLESYGWVVGGQPVSVEELVIPEELDDSYSQYLELQASQGFDLTSYQGKRVKRYTYQVANYPSGDGEVLADLLIHKNTVIGGEVLSAQPGGFIHGLERPGAS